VVGVDVTDGDFVGEAHDGRSADRDARGEELFGAGDGGVARAREREVFGQRLAELGMVQRLLADSEIDIEASRSLIWRAAWQLDQGDRAAQETSIAKTFVAEAVGRVVDRALQICGALGVSNDILLSRFYREVRPFRIYDGPSETHRWAIARRAVRQAG